MNDAEDRGRKFRPEAFQDFGQGFEPAGRTADDDNGKFVHRARHNVRCSFELLRGPQFLVLRHPAAQVQRSLSVALYFVGEHGHFWARSRNAARKCGAAPTADCFASAANARDRLIRSLRDSSKNRQQTDVVAYRPRPVLAANSSVGTEISAPGLRL